MEVRKIVCDHCGKILDNKKDCIGYDIKTVKDEMQVDLCADCVSLFEFTVNDFLGRLFDYYTPKQVRKFGEDMLERLKQFGGDASGVKFTDDEE